MGGQKSPFPITLAIGLYNVIYIGAVSHGIGGTYLLEIEGMSYRIGSRAWAFKKTIIGPLKCKMADIRHLENRHDVIFCAEGGPIWITISQNGAE